MTSEEEATNFSLCWMILDDSFFFSSSFLLVHCSKSKNWLAQLLYFLTMLEKRFVLCFVLLFFFRFCF